VPKCGADKTAAGRASGGAGSAAVFLQALRQVNLMPGEKVKNGSMSCGSGREVWQKTFHSIGRYSGFLSLATVSCN
jgi:hypothetical protein